MEYNTYAPSQGLTKYIKCFWTLSDDASGAGVRQRIVPDGCMEMIFHLGDHFIQFVSNDSFVQPKAFVFGQITEPLEIAPSGRSDIFAVRFHPEGFNRFATIPLRSMYDRAVPLDELYGSSGFELERCIAAAESVSARMEIVSIFLHQRIIETGGTDELVRSAVDLLIDSKGQQTLQEVVTGIQISRRQLERRFSDEVGLTPKQLSRIIRLQNALAGMKEKRWPSFTVLAAECGYFDQAHFIRDFRAFTGFTPSGFYGENTRMTGFFSDNGEMS